MTRKLKFVCFSNYLHDTLQDYPDFFFILPVAAIFLYQIYIVYCLTLDKFFGIRQDTGKLLTLKR